MERKLDRTDIGILNALQKDCRISNKKLGLMLNKTQSPIQQRIQQMKGQGLIKRFSAILDPKLVGRGLIGYVQVNVEKHTEESLTAFMEEAAKLEEIMECYHMTGAIDFLLRIAIKDMDEYSRVLVKKLGNLPGVRQFTSFFVLSEIKSETAFVLK
ncbi:Lrp/AsnC family transcriptional regulator [Mucilaginibacter aquariorum]|uniref:Lrp/AsnC family transcriptional regulator n=1 Tax=Mucilaginibacter aquariorum TaxID=2967225 RepID=A0ABT1SXB5_9SPHI|nr:Lrp/AsnC family transcriptional regulator [Mucilaginibacter aquariorum]MCQ6956996.1 Lrp/AsnC family transcriptional regulator [Mucilaginibacter aquariorum]